jgi:hypothetical protein
MREISGRVKIILKISPHICEKLKRFLKFCSKMSYFGLKSQICLKNCECGIVYVKLKGHKNVWRAALSQCVIYKIHTSYKEQVVGEVTDCCGGFLERCI